MDVPPAAEEPQPYMYTSMFARGYQTINDAPSYQLPLVPWPEKVVPVPAPTVVGYAPAMQNMMLASGTYAKELEDAQALQEQQRQLQQQQMQ